MGIAAKSLASGQLAAAKGTIYTVPASTKAYVRWISIHNTSGSTTETVRIYAKQSAGTSKIIWRGVLEPNAGARVIDMETLPLSASDTLEGDSTNATTTDYFIAGAEET